MQDMQRQRSGALLQNAENRGTFDRASRAALGGSFRTTYAIDHNSSIVAGVVSSSLQLAELPLTAGPPDNAPGASVGSSGGVIPRWSRLR